MGHRSKMRHYPYHLVDPSSQAASDAGWPASRDGEQTFMAFCLSGENFCQYLHTHYDWAAMREWVCDSVNYCLSDTGFFGTGTGL